LWEDGNSLSVRGGELKGLLDVRGSPNYKGIPYYIRKLNEFVRTFAIAFNEGIVGNDKVAGHVDGYGTNGNTGIRFLTNLYPVLISCPPEILTPATGK